MKYFWFFILINLVIFLIFLMLNYSTYNGNQKTKINHEKDFKKR